MICIQNNAFYTHLALPERAGRHLLNLHQTSPFRQHTAEHNPCYILSGASKPSTWMHAVSTSFTRVIRRIQLACCI